MDPRSKNPFFNNLKKEYFAFLDETGNTGLHFLDPQQKFFVLGNAFSRKNLDQTADIYFKEIHNKLQSEELHANVVGNKGLSAITPDLLSLITDHDIRFHFSVIEKKHYLKIILFHHFYDNGPNPAVNTFAQGVRALRLLLSLHFCQLVTDEHLNIYLNSLKRKNLNLYSELHQDLAECVKRSPFDNRTKELLFDALIYTAKNPKEIFESMSLDSIASPNNTAFVLMINNLNGGFDKNTVFRQMIHDEQDEFGNSLKNSFTTFSSMYHPSMPTTFITDYQDAKILKGTKFDLMPSKDSFGLQTIDPALWLFKRNILSEKEDSPYLWHEISKRMSFTGISFGLHVQEVEENHATLMSRHLTEEQINKGHELIRMAESKRLKYSRR